MTKTGLESFHSYQSGTFNTSLFAHQTLRCYSNAVAGLRLNAVIVLRRMGLVTRTVLVFSLMARTILPAELSGIWTGVAPGRHNTKEDVAFQFKIKGRTLTGKLFGDEFDLPIAEASVAGNDVRFSVTTTNYYSGAKMKSIYTGTVAGDVLELTRERLLAPGEEPPEHENLKQTFSLKKLTP